MNKILSADTLVADIIVSPAASPELAGLVEKYGLKPGDKKPLDPEQLAEFNKAVQGRTTTITPGGSSANMLTTLAKLLPGQAQVTFIGIPGEGQYGEIIRKSMEEAGINMMPPTPPVVMAQPAISFVIVLESGQCTIATHPGNARELIKPELVTEELVQQHEIVLVQGSLWYKFDPGLPDRLVALAHKQRKQLWLTLPTQAHFGEDEAKHFQRMLPAAHLVLGNEAELMRVYPGSPKLEDACEQLHDTLLKARTKLKIKDALGFITCGRKGAVIISPDDIEYVPAVAIKDSEIINTLGAGDTSYAGFTAARLNGQLPAPAAQIAMTLAAQKLRVNGPRLVDPLTSLLEANPKLAAMLPAAA